MINTAAFWKLVKKQASQKRSGYHPYLLCLRSTAFEAAWQKREFRDQCSQLTSEFLREIGNALFIPYQAQAPCPVCLFRSNAANSIDHEIIRDQFVDWNIKRLSKNLRQCLFINWSYQFYFISLLYTCLIPWYEECLRLAVFSFTLGVFSAVIARLK